LEHVTAFIKVLVAPQEVRAGKDSSIAGDRPEVTEKKAER
jgi:hypothetical protein